MEKVISIIFSLLFCGITIAQTDSLPDKQATFAKSLMIPAGLAVTSTILNRTNIKRNLQTDIQNSISTNTHIDDYTQYAPVAVMYGADLLKVPAKNNFWGQSKNLFFSQLGTAVIVLSLKKSLNITRPNGENESFPSGHTSRAFVSSQVLYQEFKNSNKLLAHSGYLFSVPTGFLRVTNNQHWVPDVLLGAAIGIAVTNTIYYINPLKNWKLFQKKEINKKTALRFIPVYSETYTGLNVTFKF